LFREYWQIVARYRDDVSAVGSCSVLYGKEGVPRIRWSVKAVQERQITQREVHPVQAPSREVVAARAGSYVRQMHRHVQPFVSSIQIALIPPHLKTFTRDSSMNALNVANMPNCVPP
jgi:hypothetical protein